MGPSVVRTALEAQSRYSRKRHREAAYEARTGEDNKIRKWAELMGIAAACQFGDTTESVGAQLRLKPKRLLIEEIVHAVDCGAAREPMAAATPENQEGAALEPDAAVL